MIRTFELRLQPTKDQILGLNRILEDCRNLYNFSLQERTEAWESEKRAINYYDQALALTERRKDPQIRWVSVGIQQALLKRLERAFVDFFRRVKNKEMPGYPRFKSKDRFNSFDFSYPIRMKGNFLKLPSFSYIKFRCHQKLVGILKHATIKRLNNKWVAVIVVDIGEAPDKCPIVRPIGVDLGVTTLATLSNGEEIKNPRFYKKLAIQLAKANKCFARKKRGSKNRIKAKEMLRRAYQRISNARKNFLHHVSKDLVQTYDLIVHEDLRILNMIKGSSYAASLMDVAWGKLLWQLSYKAEEAGRTIVA